MVLAAAVLLLLLLIGRWRLNAFLALLIAALAVGVVNGMSPMAALHSMLKGIGETMGSLVLILVFGAILGMLIEESGAAHAIAHALTEVFGLRRLQFTVVITGFLVGLPEIRSNRGAEPHSLSPAWRARSPFIFWSFPGRSTCSASIWARRAPSLASTPATRSRIQFRAPCVITGEMVSIISQSPSAPGWSSGGAPCVTLSCELVEIVNV